MLSDNPIGALMLGRYRVVSTLAKGGQGTIYLARQEGAAGFVRPVVLKRIRSELLVEDEQVRMFTREARILSNMRHPNIVTVLDFGQEGDSYVMVLDYVHGYNLKLWNRFVRAKRGPFPVEIAVSVVSNVLKALEYAHNVTDSGEARVVHRDVTPANILVDVEGHVKLTDFGIARLDTEATEVGSGTMIKGTLPYVAPELWDGATPDPRSDVYACGLVLHSVLAGKNEFTGGGMHEVWSRIMHHQPTRLDELRNDVRKPLADAVAWALEKDPSKRPATAGQLAQALRRAHRVSFGAGADPVAVTAAQDFTDPTFSEITGADRLDELEQAWQRETPGMRLSTPPAQVGEDLELTLDVPRSASVPSVDEVTAGGGKTPPSAAGGFRPTRDELPSARRTPASRRTAWIIGATVVGVLALGVGVAAYLAYASGGESPEQAQSRYIVVRGTDDGEGDDPSGAGGDEGDQRDEGEQASGEQGGDGDGDGTQGGAEADEAGSEPPDGAGDGSGDRERRRTRSPGPDQETRLTRAFARQQGELRECFQNNALDVEGSPRISVDFDIASSGAVESARLDPPELRGTPLGGCILSVARQTPFGDQPKAVSFTIPIKAQRR